MPRFNLGCEIKSGRGRPGYEVSGLDQLGF